MTSPIDRAFVEIIPDLRQFTSRLQTETRGMINEFNRVANDFTREGVRAGQNFGGGLRQGYNEEQTRLRADTNEFLRRQQEEARRLGQGAGGNYGQGFRRGYIDEQGQLRDEHGRLMRRLGDEDERYGRNDGRTYGRGFAMGARASGTDAGRVFAGSFRNAIASVGIGYLVFSGLSKAAQFAKNAIFGFNSTVEQSKIAFTTMLGSGKRAQSFLNDLQHFAKTTPFEFPELIKNAQLMMGMGISSKNVIPYLTALGNSVASVGGNTDTLNNTILAFSQMSARGKVTMDNLNQLLQGGVPQALTILAAKFHVSTARMQEMISAGKVSSAVALPALVEGIQKGTSATAALGGMMDKQSHTFQGALSNINDALTQSLAGAFRPFFTAVSRGADRLASYLGSDRFSAFAAGFSRSMMSAGHSISALLPVAREFFIDTVVPFARRAADIINNLVHAFISLVRTLAPLAPMAHEIFGVAFRAAVVVAQQLARALRSVTGFLQEHGVATRSVVVALGAGYLAMRLFRIVTLSSAGALRLMALWTGIDASALNVLTLRQKVYMIWTTASTRATALFRAVMATSLGPVGLIVVAIAALAAGLIYAYKHSTTFRNIVNAAFRSVRSAGIAMWNFLKDAWDNVGRPIFEVAKRVVQIWWSVNKAIFNAIVATFRWVWRTADAIWDNVGRPVFRAVQLVVRANLAYLRNIWEIVVAVWRTTWRVISGAWNNVGRPIFSAVVRSVRAIINPIRSALSSISRAWSSLWSGMRSTFGRLWGGITGAIRSGVNRVIDVLNGFISKINWVLDKLPGNVSIRHIPHLSSGGVVSGGGPRFFRAGGVVDGVRSAASAVGGAVRRFAKGFVVPGYQPGVDGVHALLSPGEGVIVPEAVRALGGKPFVDTVNRMFRGGGHSRPSFGRFAPVISHRFDQGGTVDLDQVNRLFHGGGGGGIFGSIGHFVGGVARSVGATVKALSDLARRGVANVLRSALNAAESPVRGLINHLPGTIFRSLVRGGFNSIDGAIRGLINKLGGQARKSAIAAGPGGAIPPGRVSDWALQAVKIAGFPISWVPAIVRRAMYESAGNPHAINLWDINAKQGHPSKGLMQTIDGTFNAYKIRGHGDIWNPIDNIIAAIRYIRSNYGSISRIDPPTSGYATGAWNIMRDQIAKIHRGEMILPTTIASKVRNEITSSSSDIDEERLARLIGLAVANALVGARLVFDGSGAARIVTKHQTIAAVRGAHL